MTNSELADSLTVSLFATRDSVGEAYNYAISVANACDDNKVGVMTAIHVLMNAIADEIRRNENEGD